MSHSVPGCRPPWTCCRLSRRSRSRGASSPRGGAGDGSSEGEEGDEEDGKQQQKQSSGAGGGGGEADPSLIINHQANGQAVPSRSPQPIRAATAPQPPPSSHTAASGAAASAAATKFCSECGELLRACDPDCNSALQAPNAERVQTFAPPVDSTCVRMSCELGRNVFDLVSCRALPDNCVLAGEAYAANYAQSRALMTHQA